MELKSKKPVSIKLGQREPGVIDKNIFIGKEDHGILTCNIPINLQGGSTQGFGNLCLTPELLDAFTQRLCWVFGVSHVTHLAGLRCFALRPWGNWNDDIEGLESSNGRRFVITQWLREQKLEPVTTKLENRIKHLKNSISYARKTIARSQKELKTVKEGYIEWSTFTGVL
jgi:hypothetical protein